MVLIRTVSASLNTLFSEALPKVFLAMMAAKKKFCLLEIHFSGSSTVTTSGSPALPTTLSKSSPAVM
jgi:hypothetical protein